MPTKIKMAAVILNANVMSRFERDNNKLPSGTPIFEVQQHSATMWFLSDVRVTGESKMAVINRKYIWNDEYLSLYTLQQRDSNGCPHISGPAIRWDWCDYSPKTEWLENRRRPPYLDPVLLTGDFNVRHDRSEDAHAVQLWLLLDIYGFMLFPIGPTHQHSA